MRLTQKHKTYMDKTAFLSGSGHADCAAERMVGNAELTRSLLAPIGHVRAGLENYTFRTLTSGPRTPNVFAVSGGGRSWKVFGHPETRSSKKSAAFSLNVAVFDLAVATAYGRLVVLRLPIGRHHEFLETNSHQPP